MATIAAWEAPLRSRAIHDFVKLPEPALGEDGFLRALLAVIRGRHVDTIIPITDRALVAIAPHDTVLRAHVALLAPTPEQLRAILDKGATTRLSLRLGIPVPVTSLMRNPGAAQTFLSRLNYPVFLKTRDKAEALGSVELGQQDTHFCVDRAELDQRLAASSSPENVLIQERASGDDVGLAVLIRGGNVLCCFQYRARKLLPAEGGVCVFACTERVNTALAACAVRLLRELKWEGVAQLDFRHNRHTEEFAFLEINGRFWGSTQVAVQAGADFPLYAWKLSRGVIPTVVPYRTGLEVRWLEGDLRRLWGIIASKPARWRRIGRALAEFVWDFRPSVYGMSWSWKDPLPSVDTFFQLGWSWLLSRIQRKPPARPVKTGLPGRLIDVR